MYLKLMRKFLDSSEEEDLKREFNLFHIQF